MTDASINWPLHLRLLYPHLLTLPKNDPRRNATPTITKSPAIDQELFMYMALLMRDFIHPWYHLVTQDQDLTDALVDTITGVIRKLEKRCCEQVDWTELLLISIPKLLTIHWRDYRQAKTRFHMNHASGLHSLEELFHGMQPHISFQVGEREYQRQLVDAIFPFILNKNDSNNKALRLLLREIIANIVLYNVIESLTDPYTLHMIICKLLQRYEPLLDEYEASGKFAGTFFSAMTHEDSSTDSAIDTLKKTPSLSSSSTFINNNNSNNNSNKNKRKLTIKPSITIKPTTVSSPKKGTVVEEEVVAAEEEGLSSKLRRLQAIQKEQRQQQGVNDPYDDLTSTTTNSNTTFTSQKLFSFGYITLQVVLSPFRSLYFYLQALFTHSQKRYHQVNQHQKRTRHARLIEPTTKFLRIAFLIDDRPVVQWGWQMIAMFLWPILRVFGGGLLIDKFLEQTILHVLSEPFLVFYLRLGRELLWPNGVFMQRGKPVTPLQREQMRIRAERLLVIALPQPLTHTLFGTDDMNQLQSHLHDTLAPLNNKYINKHLMYLLIDLIISKIFPELVDHNMK
ncbi:unnamed protein product [Cunninghamella echinulata]